MKKFLLLVATPVLGLMALLTPATAFAVNSSLVSGVIADSTGAGIVGATVQVTCQGLTKSGKSGSYGRYQIGFTPSSCRVGQTVMVIASSGSMSGSGAGTMNTGDSLYNRAYVDIIISTPEAATSRTYGYVKKNSVAVPGASVTVKCQNNTKTATADQNGYYSVDFADAYCRVGQLVTVTATNSKVSGNATGTMGYYDMNFNAALINVNLTTVVVPEYGVVTGVGAAVIGLGLLAYFRRQSA
jgi:hypothetical protein